AWRPSTKSSNSTLNCSPPDMTEQSLAEKKAAIHAAAHAQRKAQADKDAASQQTTDRVMQMDQHRAAGCVMWYVHVRDEVRTRHALPAALNDGKRVVVPHCSDG